MTEEQVQYKTAQLEAYKKNKPTVKRAFKQLNHKVDQLPEKTAAATVKALENSNFVEAVADAVAVRLASPKLQPGLLTEEQEQFRKTQILYLQGENRKSRKLRSGVRKVLKKATKQTAAKKKAKARKAAASKKKAKKTAAETPEKEAPEQETSARPAKRLCRKTSPDLASAPAPEVSAEALAQEAETEAAEEFKCPQCKFVAKSQRGLRTHQTRQSHFELEDQEAEQEEEEEQEEEQEEVQQDEAEQDEAEQDAEQQVEPEAEQEQAEEEEVDFEAVTEETFNALSSEEAFRALWRKLDQEKANVNEKLLVLEKKKDSASKALVKELSAKFARLEQLDEYVESLNCKRRREAEETAQAARAVEAAASQKEAEAKAEAWRKIRVPELQVLVAELSKAHQAAVTETDECTQKANEAKAKIRGTEERQKEAYLLAQPLMEARKDAKKVEDTARDKLFEAERELKDLTKRVQTLSINNETLQDLCYFSHLQNVFLF